MDFPSREIDDNQLLVRAGEIVDIGDDIGDALPVGALPAVYLGNIGIVSDEILPVAIISDHGTNVKIVARTGGELLPDAQSLALGVSCVGEGGTTCDGVHAGVMGARHDYVLQRT